MKRRSLAAILALAAWSASVTAQAETHALAAKVGLLGLGVEYAYSFNDLLAVRLGLNASEIGFSAQESGIDYDFDFVWDSMSVALDVYPTRRALRVTAGVLRNDNRLDAISSASAPMLVGDRTYAPEEIGTLRGVVKFDDTAPFAAVGWDWSRRRRGFGVSFDAGVVKQGEPQVTLAADGGLVGEPAFEEDVEREEAELRSALEDFDLLPFATLGFVFRF